MCWMRDAFEPPKAEDLVRLLELTAAEANLASLLCAGRSLADAADRLRIAAGTARSHLKSIFSKTGTNRQAALIALMLRIAAPL